MSTTFPATRLSNPDLDATLALITRSVIWLDRAHADADEASQRAGLDLLGETVAPLAPRIKEAQNDPRLKRSARRYRARQLAKEAAADAANEIAEALGR